jgi:membrane fusion protein, copper/silver efflux system
MVKKRKKSRMILVTTLLVLLITGSGFILHRVHKEREMTAESTGATKMYVCSMEPQIIRDKPGNCPICGMALIEKKDFEQNYADNRLNDVVKPVNETVLASVNTLSPVEADMPLVIEASGVINYDTRSIRTVSAHFRGIIEQSYVKYVFQPIHKGQEICRVYCPEIYATHMNYVNLIKNFFDQPEMTREARAWFANIGLTDEQVTSLAKSEKPDYHLAVYSDVEGFVVSSDFNPEQTLSEQSVENPLGVSITGGKGIGLSEGVVIEAGSPLFKVISTESVRADLKVRNEDAGLLYQGQKVLLTDAVSPERKLVATVSQIEPLNGGLFQLVRVYTSDPEKLLLPGMKIQAQIMAGSKTSLWVPKSAIVNLGMHEAVFLQIDSVFVATEVRTGLHSGNQVEISSGIDQYSIVAANASLLTDSDGFIKTSTR